MSPVVITIGNNKGGVGKTTTCVNLAAGLAGRGRRVLVVDGDPQANTTSSLLPDITERERRSLVHALEDDAGRLTDHAVPGNLPGLSIVPNSIKCMEWEVKSVAGMDSMFGFGRIMENDPGLADYDYLLIDTPPNIGPMLRNALLVSDHVIVPCPMGDQYALDGFSIFSKVISQAARHNTGLRLMGVLLTKFDRRCWTHKRNQRIIRDFFATQDIPVFEVQIRVNIDLDRAHSCRMSIFEFDKRKTGAKDYGRLADEVMQRVQG